MPFFVNTIVVFTIALIVIITNIFLPCLLSLLLLLSVLLAPGHTKHYLPKVWQSISLAGNTVYGFQATVEVPLAQRSDGGWEGGAGESTETLEVLRKLYSLLSLQGTAHKQNWPHMDHVYLRDLEQCLKLPLALLGGGFCASKTRNASTPDQKQRVQQPLGGPKCRHRVRERTCEVFLCRSHT